VLISTAQWAVVNIYTGQWTMGCGKYFYCGKYIYIAMGCSKYIYLVMGCGKYIYLAMGCSKYIYLAMGCGKYIYLAMGCSKYIYLAMGCSKYSKYYLFEALSYIWMIWGMVIIMPTLYAHTSRRLW